MSDETKKELKKNEDINETIEELKKRLAEEEKALKAKYAAKMEILKKRKQRFKNLEAKKLRAQENHAKYLLAGYVLAEAKKSKNIDMLINCLATLKTDRDKMDMQVLIDTLEKQFIS
jgi:cell division septum initiation protein DivIVA